VDLSNKDTVEKLIRACVKGDRKSQQLLYKSFYGKMMSVCMRYARNREEAQDILHDGFIKVFMKLESFENKGSLEGWIRRIVANSAIDFVRTRKDFYIREDQEFLLDDLQDDTTDCAEMEALTQMKAEAVIALIQELSPAYRMVFNMYVIENMPHKEIAEQLNISIGTSKSNLAKAKMKLKELVESHFKVYDKQ
jgi:RNA polymerase sigma-70 factor (ECF subfamily)